METKGDRRINDAPESNYVDGYAPLALQPFLRIMRLDRPIGIWLLLWPCWWSLGLAAHTQNMTLPDLTLLALFALEAIIMRSAGCTYNDIIDCKIDAMVARTRNRPIPSKQVSLTQAYLLTIVLCLTGLMILLYFNWLTIIIGIFSIPLIIIYPFMKRITWWPQLFLGLAYNWGAILGWAATANRIEPAAIALYVGGIFWTLGYDTIYAHQDKDDDKLIGIKSSARLLGTDSKMWIGIFYTIALAFITLAGLLAGAGVIYLISVAMAGTYAICLLYTADLDDPQSCLAVFRYNRNFGGIIFLGIMLDAHWNA